MVDVKTMQKLICECGNDVWDVFMGGDTVDASISKVPVLWTVKVVCRRCGASYEFVMGLKSVMRGLW